MIVININGIDVKFPFEPYEIQKNYMHRVIECLTKEQHGILESPTGTGKTLSLLCASLAWLEAKRAQIRQQRTEMFTDSPEDYLKKMNDQVMAKFSKHGKAFVGLPTIIYASRTHTQLSQAMNEMKMTAYNYMNASVIGSREQMCIHEDVVKELNNHTKVALCGVKVKTRACNFFNNFQRLKEDPKIKNASPIMDIEDLVSMGNKHKVCPYFMAKDLKSNADIIFMPYNYLLEPKFRKTLGIELANHVIILDEAHNVERMCEESASLQIKSTDIALAIEEVTAIMKSFSEDSVGFSEEEAQKDFTADDLVLLKEMLLNLEKEIDAIPLVNSSDGSTFDGTYMIDLLEKTGIKQSNVTVLWTLLEKLCEYLSVVSGDSPYSRKGNGLKTIEDALRIVFMETTGDYRERINKCYKVHVRVEDSKAREVKTWLSKMNKGSCRVLSYWCFSPGFGMKLLLQQGVRTCILTSGTLAPLKPLITELEFKNPVCLENPHIVSDSQVCVRVVSNGPDNERLSCTFQNRGNEKYLRSLGFTIMNIVRLIPNGLLVFFPSYPIMSNCMKFWQEQGIWTNISDLKAIYTEPKDKLSFGTAMNEYYSKIKDPTLKGAIFMGVCRGKISEGLDFADANGRGVIIVGLPFAPIKDPRVILKKRYLDICRSSNQEYVSGDGWYTMEASRAVNQAIGRVIRHKNDYGAILLLDERFKQQNIQSQLSLWLRNRIRHVQNFGEITRDLRLFYKNAEEKFPLNCLKDNAKSEAPKTEAVSRKGYNYFNFGSSQEPSESSSSSASTSNSSEALERYKRGAVKQISAISKKMKIRLIPQSSSTEAEVAAVEEKLSDATKEYIAMVKRSLDVQTFRQFISALQSYQKSKDVNELTANMDLIFKSKMHLRYLLQGVERYLSENHRRTFREFFQQYR